jgi:hypothetical protein
MAILNYTIRTMDRNYILIARLEIKAEIHIFLADAKLLSDMVPLF